MPALTPTNSLFLKTGILKFNEVFNLQVCKLMLNTLREFEVDHSCFTPVSMVYTHNTKNNNFVIEKPRTGLGLNSFKYYGLICALVFQKFLKT